MRDLDLRQWKALVRQRADREGREVLAAQRKEWQQFFALIRDLAGVRYA